MYGGVECFVVLLFTNYKIDPLKLYFDGFIVLNSNELFLFFIFEVNTLRVRYIIPNLGGYV